MSLVVAGTGEVVAPHAGPLAALESAHALLARAETVDEAKEIRDKAEALRLYSKQAGLGLDMQNRCAELKLRAERQAGLLLAVMPELGRGKSDTLSPLGIERHQSSRWQRIASVSDDEFERYISDTAEAHREITSAGALKLAKRAAASDKPAAPPLRVVSDEDPDTFAVIVIDPPWQYDNKATRGAAEDHYPTMSYDELAALELPAAENAHLYLWVTNNFIRDGLELCDLWGFNYKTLLTWVKPQMGMGNYFRSVTEHVVFGVRGSLPTLRRDKTNVINADRTRHSAKPDAFYDLVETMSPGPYLEMFARRRRMGWHTWGNEA